MGDYYRILELTHDADSAKIRAAYKRLAMKYHPDRNPGNKAAEEKFKEVNEAYHVLSDVVKKSRYDARYASQTSTVYTEEYWHEINRMRYQQWKQRYDRTHSVYTFDKRYFKIQGLAFLVFLIISGFCFGVIHLTMYIHEQKLESVRAENRKLLSKVDALFGAGRFDEAFVMINRLRDKDPMEFMFGYHRDSLVATLRDISDREFKEHDFENAAKHFNILRKYEQPIRLETLNRLATCEYYLGNYRESVLALKHLHNQQPWNLELIYQIGIISYEKLNNPEDALQYFTLGKKLFKENLTKVYGEAFEVVMNSADAPDIYYDIFNARARINIQLKNYREAITDCNWAIFLRPAQGETYKLRAIASVNAGERYNVCSDLSQARRYNVDVVSLRRAHCR